MRVELDLEESHALFTAVVDSLLAGLKFSTADGAALKRWRSESMRPGSDGMHELAAKINADIDRGLKTRAKSALVRPDWK
jgi:hypothetical protein